MRIEQRNMKSVLLISYDFPPVGGGNQVSRPFKLAKYLHDHRWNVTVVTSELRHRANLDESRLSELPHSVRLVRVRDPLAGRPSSTMADTDSARVKNGNVFTRQLGLQQLVQGFQRVMCIPDERILWATLVARKLRKLVASQPIDCIYTTSGPNGTHMAGLILHILTGIPWVADFQQPWLDHMYCDVKGTRRRIERWLEAKVFKHASSVVTVTDSFRELFAKKYPRSGARIEVIRDGVDPADFAMAEEGRRFYEKSFTIFHEVNAYSNHSLSVFLQALGPLLRYGRIAPYQLRLKLAWHLHSACDEEHQKLITRLGVDSVVELLGPISHRNRISHVGSSDMLLLIGERRSEARMYVPAELYEYLYAGKPILGILEEGEAANLVRTLGVGTVISPRDQIAIMEHVVDALREHRAMGSGTHQVHRPTDLHPFTWQTKAQQLSRILENFVRKRGTRQVEQEDSHAIVEHVMRQAELYETYPEVSWVDVYKTSRFASRELHHNKVQ